MSNLTVSGVFCGLIGLLSRLAIAAEPDSVVNIWPGKAPGDGAPARAESVRKSTSAAGPQKEVFDVYTPQLEIFKPAKDQDTGVSILILPGGGFSVLKMDYEGEDCATWLNSIGVTGIVIKYRVPQRPGAPSRYWPAFQDTQRAMSLVRSKVKEWGLDPKRIGLLGFSAGSVVGAVAEGNYEHRSYQALDEIDKVSCRPDFAMLIYPGTLLDKDGKMVSDVKISKQTPPTFIAVANNDKTENAIAVYQALKQAGVSTEMHIYADGEHGFGMRPTTQPHGTWTKRMEEWMINQGLLGSKN